MILSKAPPSSGSRPVSPAGIIASQLTALRDRAEGLDQMDEAFRQALNDVEALAAGLEPYMEASSTPESPALAGLVQRTRSEDWLRHFEGGATSVALEQEMLSGHLEGQFLKLLIHAMRAERVLEIGLFTGYSALAMAEALPDHGEIIACEIDAYAAAFAEEGFRSTAHAHKISVHVGPAASTLTTLAADGQRFDLIFIDADKGGYATYLEQILEGGLLQPHGLICVDNTLMQGQPYLPGHATPNGDAIAAFNRMVKQDPRLEQVMLPLRDGVTLIRRL